ncbi:MAG: flagellar hook protein FlgE [Nitrospiraceae bacterium]|nr:flagellar hook protein FlgE [Nitrospiraceae bacterium]
MTRSLSAAISGIDANQSMLDTIGNNIANVNTVGYQSSDVQFADLLYQQAGGAGSPVPGVTGGTNPIEIGSGVRVASTLTNFAQGTIQQTGVQTDLAIQGQGFLVTSQGGSTYYTRAGNLQLDALGELVTPEGQVVQGWVPGANGQINTSGPLSNLVIPQGQAANPQVTKNITLGGNLPTWSGTGTPPSYTATVTAYDSLGGQIPITITFAATTTPDTWSVVATAPNPAGGTDTLTPTGTTISFDPTSGQLTSSAPIALSGFTGYPDLPAGYSMNLDFPAPGTPQAVTQFAGTSSIQVTSQDGFPSGSLNGFTIGSDGTITGNYSNGRSQALGQVAIATFANNEGLAKVGGLSYQATVNSGAAQLGTAGAGGRGTLVGGAVEGSNVDLGTQLTDLIVAQTAYQANTKVVSTTATVLQNLVQTA